MTVPPNSEVFRQTIVPSATDAGKILKVILESATPLTLTSNAAASASDCVCFADDAKFDLEVYADDLTIEGNLKFPGRSVTIVSRVLHGKVLPGKEATISVSGLDGAAPPDKLKVGESPPNSGKKKLSVGPTGNPGVIKVWYPYPASGVSDEPGGDAPDGDPDEMNGEPGQQGAPGMPGGSITIVCNDIEGYVLLRAQGGKGGKGQDGQDGAKGGTGGAGADATTGGFMNKGWGLATGGGKGGKGGKGGNGGRAGDGGEPGTILTYARNSREKLGDNWQIIAGQAHPYNPFPSSSDSGSAGGGGRKGIGGAPGDGGAGGRPSSSPIPGFVLAVSYAVGVGRLSELAVERAAGRLQAEEAAQAFRVLSGDTGLNGIKGEDGDDGVNVPYTYFGNSEDHHWVDSDSDSLEVAAAGLIPPRQLLMLMDYTRRLWLTADPKGSTPTPLQLCLRLQLLQQQQQTQQLPQALAMRS